MRRLIGCFFVLSLSCSGATPPVNNPLCGNGIVEAGEECDDANTQAGDGCDQTCQNEEAPPIELVINEVIASAPNDGPDAVELLNLGAQAVDLTGFRLVDDAQNTFVFPAGSSLAAGARLLLEQDAPGSFTFGV